MAYVLALDQGTTSSRTIVFGIDGRIHSVAVEALTQGHTAPEEIGAIAIKNQRETAIAWDRGTGRPIHNAIVWQDGRTSRFCEKLRAGGHESEIQKRTGLKADPHFSGTKVRWILAHQPTVHSAAGLGVGLLKDRSTVSEQWIVKRRFGPCGDRTQTVALREHWSRVVERSESWDVR